MYGLDKNIDLKFFIGKMLIQLCIGQFEFGLICEENISISVNGEFTFKNKKRNNKEGYSLRTLLGKKIINAKLGKQPGDLMFKFEGNDELVLHDSFDKYESYTFWGPKGLVVV